MKKFIFIITLILFLLLDWAALDDITTGHDPSIILEYLIVLISIPVLDYLFHRLYLK